MFFTLMLAARPACHVSVGMLLGVVLSQVVAAQELTFDEVLHLATTTQPQLDARRSAIEAAHEAAVLARELPDPKLKLGVINVPIEGDNALSLNAEPMTMTMIGIAQEFPRQSKRSLRGDVLDLSGEFSAGELSALRLRMRREAALAWLDAWTAERAIEVIGRQQDEARIELDSLAIALRNNRAGVADLASARVALELLRDREQEQLGAQNAARAMLARWIGPRAQAPLPVSLPQLRQPMNPEQILSDLKSHPRIATADVQVRIAESEARLAGLSSRPDWSMEMAYARRGAQFGDMVSLQFQLDLPILQARRQDRAVAAKLAQARQARELREDELRDMDAAVLQLHAQWLAADARAQRFEQRVLPEARNGLHAATAAYRSGKGVLGDVLAARRALLDLELEALMRRVEVARLAVKLDYFSATGE